MYKCDTCEKTFVQKLNYIRHLHRKKPCNKYENTILTHNSENHNAPKNEIGSINNIAFPKCFQ